MIGCKGICISPPIVGQAEMQPLLQLKAARLTASNCYAGPTAQSALLVDKLDQLQPESTVSYLYEDCQT